MVNPSTISQQDSSPEMPRFLRQNGVLAGVASGIASDLRVDVIIVRLGWIVAVCFGLGFLLYPICWIAFPKASDPTLGQRARILGVCNRISQRWSQPVGLIRLIAISLLFLSFGTAVFGYIIAHFVIPPSK